jgi:hypothetical protein
LAVAIRYALSRWEALMRYVADGRPEIDNNPVERAIRPLALGRKNWLFAGSDTGGHRAAAIASLIITAKLNDLDPEAYLRRVLAAVMLSLITTAKLNDVDPRAWLADVLARIADHPASKLDQLLPWNWTPKTIALPTAA